MNLLRYSFIDIFFSEQLPFVVILCDTYSDWVRMQILISFKFDHLYNL